MDQNKCSGKRATKIMVIDFGLMVQINGMVKKGT
jgi:hypothetical protein